MRERLSGLVPGQRRLAVVCCVCLFGLVIVVPDVAGGGHWFALGTLPGIVALLAATLRLDSSFDVTLLTRRSTPNYWNGASGGLIGGSGPLLILSMDIPQSAVPSAFLLWAVYVLLLVVLITGGTLKDVEDGYHGVDA